jgi:hypothetical protein
MKKRLWISLMLIVLVSIAGLWIISSFLMEQSETGFRLVSLENNDLLISDADVITYNWTSQELALTDGASQKLIKMGDNLYSFTSEFVIRIDGEEMYRGIFRSPIMSAIPSPPKISIMFPNVLFPSSATDDHAIRMFYPSFQPPSDQLENNAKLVEHFEGTGKLAH